MKKGQFAKAKEKWARSERSAKYRVESLNRKLKRDRPFKD